MKGVSPIIGYVLLIAASVTISIFVYSALKTYAPQEEITCPGDVSLRVEQLVCSESSNQFILKVFLKNTGLFSVDAFNIRIKNGTSPTNIEIVNRDLSAFLASTSETKSGEVILFNKGFQALKPGQIEVFEFVVPKTQMKRINEIEVIPSRFDTINEKKVYISCSNSKVIERPSCEMV